MQKKLQLLFTVVLIAITISNTSAQDAKSNFSQATLAYEAGKYKEALFYLGETERALGSTNPKIQSLKTLCLYEQGDNEAAMLELTKFFRAAPATMQATEGYKEMQALQNELQQLGKAAFNSKQASIEKEKNAELDKIRNETKKETEEYEYQLVKEAGSLKAMKTFVAKYPSSTHAGEINKKISGINNETDFNTQVLKGDKAMLSQNWHMARTSYTKALALRQDKLVENKLKECNETQYSQLVSEGDYGADNSAWDIAIKNYSAALKVINRTSTKQKLENAEDNYAFYKAQKRDEISGYLKYLNDFEDGNHVETAEDILIGKYLVLAEAQSRRGESDDVESTLETVYKYNTASIWPHYKERYYDIMLKEAEKLTKGTKEKRMDKINQSIRLYEKLNEAYSPKYTRTIDKLKRKEIRWTRDDFSFTGWHADQTNLYGLMAGSLNNRSVGIYVSGRTGDGIFETEAYWETNNNNSISESVDQKKKYTGITKSKTIYAGLGITKKIFYPLWVYAGAGVCINSELRQFEHTQTKELEYAVNKDMKYTAVNFETGLYLKLGPIVISYGVNRPINEKFTGTIVQHFGAGFCF